MGCYPMNPLIDCQLISACPVPNGDIHVESFFRTFKTESFHGETFEGMTHLYDVTKWYLDDYYNCHRMHTSLGFKSPVQYERMAA